MDPELSVTSAGRQHASISQHAPVSQHASISQPIEPGPPAARHRDGRKGSHSAASTPAFLSNLGKATLRGIRKCPQCGVYNGTRGLSCKNKACGVALRDGSAGERSGHRKRVIEVVKVVLDGEERGGAASGEEGEEAGGGAAGVQVFSVCQKGRGSAPAQLGFVELVPTDTAIATGEGATLLTRINLGRCFLPSCRQQGQRSNANPSARLMADAGGADSPDDNSVCVHVKQAMECQNLASPLALKSTVLEGLLAPAEVRDELWRLATESPGPLVQRVAADRLVVKCRTDPDHPLGLLHLTVGPGPAGKARDRCHLQQQQRQQQQREEPFHCSCQVSLRKGKGSSSRTPLAGGSEPCLHFYACVCALASDEQLASDYAAFINYSPKGELQKAGGRSLCAPGKPLHHESLSAHHRRKRLRPDDCALAHWGVSAAGSGGEGAGPGCHRKPAQRKIQCASGHKHTGRAQLVDEHTVVLGFHQWLASVTERIHQTMHYQCDGRPEPQVYLIPQEFFQALQHRLSLGSKKRRLPNATTAVVRADLPEGSFSTSTWHITSLLQLKQIFHTPELPLESTQSFVRNVDGSYSAFRCPDPPCEAEAVAVGYRADKPQVIRPLELRTFLKVGTWAEDQKEPTPFVIEWTPDVLPRSRLGELRLGFQFGHQQSGQSEHAPCDGGGAARTLGTGRNKSPAELSGAQTLEILQVVA